MLRSFPQLGTQEMSVKRRCQQGILQVTVEPSMHPLPNKCPINVTSPRTRYVQRHSDRDAGRRGARLRLGRRHELVAGVVALGSRLEQRGDGHHEQHQHCQADDRQDDHAARVVRLARAHVQHLHLVEPALRARAVPLDHSLRRAGREQVPLDHSL